MAEPKNQAPASNETVTVALKMPHGLVMRLWDMVDAPESQRDGSVRTVKMARQRVEAGEVELKGYATKYDPSMPPLAVSSSFALTHDVPKDFWEEWREQNKDSDIVKNGLIFASPKADTIRGMSKERAELRCGLEPIDPTRLPKGLASYKKESQDAA